MEVKRTERGWAGHFIAADKCQFRRNTLLEYGNKKWVVSTVGRYFPPSMKGKVDTIGHNRYFETKAFEAEFDRGYWEANVEKPIEFSSPWAIDHAGFAADEEANEMHEKVVEELIEKIKGEN